jgi:hypothetical protein
MIKIMDQLVLLNNTLLLLFKLINPDTFCFCDSKLLYFNDDLENNPTYEIIDEVFFKIDFLFLSFFYIVDSFFYSSSFSGIPKFL